MTAMREAYTCLKDNLLQDSERALRSIQELAFKMTEKSNIVVLQAESHVIDDIEAGGIHLGDLRDILQEKSENLGNDAQEGAMNHQHGGRLSPLIKPRESVQPQTTSTAASRT